MSAPYFAAAGILVAYIQASIPKVQMLRATTGESRPVEIPVMNEDIVVLIVVLTCGGSVEIDYLFVEWKRMRI